MKNGRPPISVWMDGLYFDSVLRVQEELGLRNNKDQKRKRMHALTLIIEDGEGIFEGHIIRVSSPRNDAIEYVERLRRAEELRAQRMADRRARCAGVLLPALVTHHIGVWA